MPRPQTSAAIVRVAGAWILLGAMAKLFLGSPADLPDVVQRAPLPLADTFRLAITVETIVAGLALWRPRRAWPLPALLLATFATILVLQVAGGKASCGCFGSHAKIPPLVMLLADLALLAAVVGLRPRGEDRSPPRALTVAVLLATGVLAALPWALAFAGATKEGGGVTQRDLALVPKELEGRRLADTPLAEFAGEPLPEDAVVVVWKDTCEMCQQELLDLARSEVRGEREVVLLRLPDREGEKPLENLVYPLGPWVRRTDLPDWMRVVPAPPMRLTVKAGKIVAAEAGGHWESPPR